MLEYFAYRKYLQTADRAVETATHAADTAVTGSHGAQGLSAVVLFGYDAGNIMVQSDRYPS